MVSGNSSSTLFSSTIARCFKALSHPLSTYGGHGRDQHGDGGSQNDGTDNRFDDQHPAPGALTEFQMGESSA
jgi:hypothetical protein